MSDQQLLRAYASRRDADCLATFIHRYEASLLSFASALLHDEHRAQDVVQETFVSVMLRPERLFGVASCHDWLLRVTRNLGVDAIRRSSRQGSHVRRLARDTGRLAGNGDGGPDAAEAITAAEERERVRGAIRGLEPGLRDLLVLRVQQGKSLREIAGIAGLSVGQVSYRLHAAMKALTRRLEHLEHARHPANEEDPS